MENSRYGYREPARNSGNRPQNTQRKQKVRYTRQYDFALLFLTVGIALFGVVMIYSAGYYTASLQNNPLRYVKSQLMGLGLGIAGMLVTSVIDYQVLKQKFFGGKVNLVHIAYFIALILQVVVLAKGVNLNGATRWLKIGPIQFQPAEISKIAAILFVSYAVYQRRRDLDTPKGLFRIGVFMAPLAALIATENMSSAIIVFGIVFGMCFIASKKKSYFVAAILLVGVAGAAFILFGESFRLRRIEMWRDVENDVGAFQIRQGLYAIASGGLFGKGLGQSMQKLGFIPEAYNDMIFSVICEELGVVGAALVILAFLVLIWRIVVIACHAPDLFGTMLCVGVMIQIAIQVILNICVVTNTTPSTGVALPLISYGGTSAAIIMVELGIVLSVSRQIKQK